MNAGTSAALLQAARNYIERDTPTRLFVARVDDRAGGRIASRTGIAADADRFGPGTDFWPPRAGSGARCVLADGAPFLTVAQIR